MNDSSLEYLLENEVREGNPNALGNAFEHFRPRLERTVKYRLHPQLKNRFSPEDILQEAFLDASRCLSGYLKNQEFPIFVWLWKIVGNRLANVHRDHLNTAKRNACLEMSASGSPQASSLSLACLLSARDTSISERVGRNELIAKIRELIDDMDEKDREVLTLRFFEEFSNEETSIALGISKQAASNRYVRALRRLGESLPDIGSVE